VKLEAGCDDGEVLRVIVEPIVSTEFEWSDAAMRNFNGLGRRELGPRGMAVLRVWREYEPAMDGKEFLNIARLLARCYGSALAVGRGTCLLRPIP